MGRDPENPDSFEDIEKEARDLVEENNEASIFSRKEILLTLKEKFRMKKNREQRALVNNYKNGIGRREFLKILGLTAGATYMSVNGAGMLMGKKVFSEHTNNTITGMASNDGCDVYDHDDLQEIYGSEVIELSDGDTLSGIILDQSNGHARVSATGSGWSISNVGVQGEIPAACKAMFGVGSSGEASISKVFIANAEEGPGEDGCKARDKNGHGITGIHVDKDHSGTLNIKNCNIQGMYDNAIYGSAPSTSGGGGGEVHIEDSFAANCNVSHFRLPDGSLTGSVIELTDRWYENRGVWVWGEAEVRNCVIDMDGRQKSFETANPDSNGTVKVYNTEYDDAYELPDGVELVEGNGTNPDASVPDGTPTSVKEAAGCDTAETETGSWIGGPAVDGDGSGGGGSGGSGDGSSGDGSGGDGSSSDGGSSGSGGSRDGSGGSSSGGSDGDASAQLSATGQNGIDDNFDAEFADDVEYDSCG